MPLMNVIDAAQAQLREIVRELEAVKGRLEGVLASLPDLNADVAEDDLEKMDAPTEIHSVIECVLRDWMEPAIGDLRDIAALPSEPEGGTE
jgi:hypothetical protein